MSFLHSPIFWGVVGVVGVFLGIFASAYFSNRKVLEHLEHSSKLIPKDISNIPGLTITMHGKPIQDLIATEIKFFNGGNQTIESSDFAKAEQLGAAIDGTYYGAEISSSNPNSAPAVKVVDEHTLAVDFDFLKPNDSITLILWHNGKASIRGDIKFGKVRKKLGNKSPLSLSTRMPVMLYITDLLFSALLTFSFSEIWGPSIQSFQDFFTSPFLNLSYAISLAIIVVPVLVYAFIHGIDQDLNA